MPHIDVAEAADGARWGRVVGERPESAECWIYAHCGRVAVLAPAVRVTRWTDPTRLYVLADGSLYRDSSPPRLPVCAWVVEEEEQPAAR